MTVATLTPDNATATLAPPVPTSAPLSLGNPYVEQGYAVLPGQDEVVVVSLGAVYATSPTFGPYGGAALLSGYGLDGSPLFQTTLAFDYPSMTTAIASPTVFPVGQNGEFGAAFDVGIVVPGYVNGQASYALYNAGGSQVSPPTELDPGYVTLPAVGAGTPTGFHMEWVTEGTQAGALSPPLQEASGNFAPDGSHFLISRTDGARPEPYASAGDAQSSVAVRDNQILSNGSLTGPTLPGEPVNSVTSVGIALVSGPGTVAGEAAVAWTDSGTAYAAIYYAPTATFGPVVGLDWGGATDVHVAALPSAGGFVVSWMNGGEYKGEVFDGAGGHGGIISLAGDVAGVDSHGDLYTVGLNSSGQYQVQTYAINGGSSGGGGGGGATGQTFTSDNNGDHWTGTAGNDIFNLGRGGDVVTGGGGDDTYRFAEIPWAGGHITDFNAGDVLDLTGLMSTTSDTGSDGFADGYLEITDDGHGTAQVWANYNVPGNDGWWLVETLNQVAASSLQHTGDVISIGAASGPTDVTTADASYTAPASVKTITLSGQQQTINASATDGVTIWSDNTGNTLIGGAGADVFHLGRGGDVVTGGAGADTFAYAETPWAAGRIKDFSVAGGDKVDLTGLLAASHYTGADAIADGYLKITDTIEQGAQIWSDFDGPGAASGWWLVTSLNGVTAGLLKYSDGLVTGGGDGSVIVEEHLYVAKAGITSVTLAGPGNQIVTGNTLGDTFIDNNASGNDLQGGAGNDTFVLGLGGSTVNAGPGADTIDINGVPTQASAIYNFTPGLDRVDLQGLLAALGSTGSDPFHDGHLELITDTSGNTHMLAYDPSTVNWDPVATFMAVTAGQLHYSDGWLS